MVMERLDVPLSRTNYKNMGVMELATELERQAQTKRDVIVDSRTLSAVVGEQPYQDGQDILVRDIMKLDVQFGADDVQSLELTNYAHKQMAEKCQIPSRYYERMMATAKWQLLVDNVNAWIESKDKRLIRTLDGKVRAILSDRYRVMDNYDLLFLSLAKFKEHNAQIHRCDLSETHLFVKATIPKMTFDVSEFNKDPNKRNVGDILEGGLMIRNSEVGASRFVIEPFMLRLSCMNGMVGTTKFARVHLGSAGDIGEIFSDRTKALEDETVWNKVKDFIDATFNRDIFEKWVHEGIGAKVEEPIAEPMEAVDNLVKHYKMSDNTKALLLKEFTKGENNTQWGLINAVTAVGRETPAYEHQIELETVGGELSEISVKDFNQIIKA